MNSSHAKRITIVIALFACRQRGGGYRLVVKGVLPPQKQRREDNLP